MANALQNDGRNEARTGPNELSHSPQLPRLQASRLSESPPLYATALPSESAPIPPSRLAAQPTSLSQIPLSGGIITPSTNLSPTPLSRAFQDRKTNLKLQEEAIRKSWNASRPFNQFEAQIPEVQKQITLGMLNKSRIVVYDEWLKGLAIKELKKRWIEQGIWRESWSNTKEWEVQNKHSEPGAEWGWKHENPPPDPPTFQEHYGDGHEKFGPMGFVNPDAQRFQQIPEPSDEERKEKIDLEASRPIHMFHYQVSKKLAWMKEQKRFDFRTKPDPNDPVTTAYNEVKKEWIKSGIWDRKWTILPGEQWKHERPYSVYYAEEMAHNAGKEQSISTGQHGRADDRLPSQRAQSRRQKIQGLLEENSQHQLNMQKLSELHRLEWKVFDFKFGQPKKPLVTRPYQDRIARTLRDPLREPLQPLILHMRKDHAQQGLRMSELSLIHILEIFECQRCYLESTDSQSFLRRIGDPQLLLAELARNLSSYYVGWAERNLNEEDEESELPQQQMSLFQEKITEDQSQKPMDQIRQPERQQPERPERPEQQQLERQQPERQQLERQQSEQPERQQLELQQPEQPEQLDGQEIEREQPAPASYYPFASHNNEDNSGGVDNINDVVNTASLQPSGSIQQLLSPSRLRRRPENLVRARRATPLVKNPAPQKTPPATEDVPPAPRRSSRLQQLSAAKIAAAAANDVVIGSQPQAPKKRGRGQRKDDGPDEEQASRATRAKRRKR